MPPVAGRTGSGIVSAIRASGHDRRRTTADGAVEVHAAWTPQSEII
jgi:hypothetical protein